MRCVWPRYSTEHGVDTDTQLAVVRALVASGCCRNPCRRVSARRFWSHDEICALWRESWFGCDFSFAWSGLARHVSERAASACWALCMLDVPNHQAGGASLMARDAEGKTANELAMAAVDQQEIARILMGDGDDDSDSDDDGDDSAAAKAGGSQANVAIAAVLAAARATQAEGGTERDVAAAAALVVRAQGGSKSRSMRR